MLCCVSSLDLASRWTSLSVYAYVSIHVPLSILFVHFSPSPTPTTSTRLIQVLIPLAPCLGIRQLRAMRLLELLLCALGALFDGLLGGAQLDDDDEELGVCFFVLERVSERVRAVLVRKMGVSVGLCNI